MPDHTQTDSPTHRLRLRRILVTLVGVVLFMVTIYVAGPERVGAILEADPWDIAWAFIAGIAVTTVSTFRWGVITNSLIDTHVLRWPQYWASLLTSRVLGLFVPRNASDVGIRFATLTKYGKIAPEFAAASIALDQLFDLALLVAWVGPSLVLLSTDDLGQMWWLVPVSLAAALAMMLYLGSLVRWIARLLASLASWFAGNSRLGTFFSRREARLRDLALVRDIDRGKSALVAFLTLGRYGLNAVMFWAIAQALDLGIDLWTFLLAGAAVQLSLIIAFTPGGLGVMDLGWVGILSLGGIGTTTVAAFIVAQRAFQYTLFPLLGAISYLVTAWRAPSRNEPDGG